ncbi:phage virion morphogenesis protein [Flammeovirga sp. OC4]|uniref:phage virion morphogenesis protein n=1 Tax=Flammeovirga sp. OC4 TaxID=1382345 RepID=UPI000693AE41|nr:phage virion morphogenesis protein [Flammeovirga sp. OC4]
MDDTKKLLKQMDDLGKLHRQFPTIAGTEAKVFFKDRFRSQNWIDTNTEPWKPRKDPEGKHKGKAILVQSGALKRSIKVLHKDKTSVTVGSANIPYAKIHNEGYRGNVNQKVKAHTRRKHRRTRNGVSHDVQKHKVSAHNRTLYMHIPKRQFLGDSLYLNNRINRKLNARILKIIK